jgi:dolichol-phosphate mannosyltransferase
MIYILIPLFNEAENIPQLSKNLLSFPFDDTVTYVFSDDGSTDNSKEVIRALFPENKTVILGDGVNRGPGYAFNTAFNWVLANSQEDSNTIVTLEADNTSDLKILPHMLGINKMSYDLVLASIYVQGGGIDSTGFIRGSLSLIANLMFRFMFKIHVQTLSSFYRVYSVSLVRKVQLKYPTLIQETGFICMLEILMKAIACDAKIIEVPMVLHSKNRIGKSKMKVLNTTLQYFKFLITSKI